MFFYDDNRRKRQCVFLAVLALLVSFLVIPAGHVQAADAALYPMYQRAVDFPQGDLSRLAQVLRKAQAGEEITIGFLGGSITEGRGAANVQDCYVSQVYKWWYEAFPFAKINVINAGVGGTSSYLGVHRVQKDVLDKNPDLVVVEFAVNDQDTDLHKQAYENLVRKLLDADSKPAVLLLFTSRVNGENCQDAQAQIGEYYHLPMVSYANVMNDMLRHGIYTAGQLSGDGVHPSALGSAVIGELLARYMDGIFQKEAGSIQAGTRPSVYMTSREYEHAGILSCRELDINHMGTFRKVNKSRYFPGN